MGKKIRNPRELLEACFTNVEWEYLMQSPEFKKDFAKGCETLDEVEKLSLLGHQIITDLELANPKKSPFPQVRKRKVD